MNEPLSYPSESDYEDSIVKTNLTELKVIICVNKVHILFWWLIIGISYLSCYDRITRNTLDLGEHKKIEERKCKEEY